MTRHWKRVLLLFAAFALVAVSCGDSGETTTTEAPTDTAAPTTAAPTTEAPATTAAPTTEAPADTPPAEDVVFDVGVTEEPCPDGNPDRGCIYLGILTDESGPFAAASPALVGGMRAFWAAENAGDGVGGLFDVALPDDLKKDAAYQPDQHVQRYNEIAGEVAALAMTLGTQQTLAAVADYVRDGIVAPPASWYSGWPFADVDQGTVLEYGAPYCYEGMNAVDWSIGAVPAAGLPDVASIGIIHHPTDYGLDYSEGAQIAAEANGIEVAWELPIIPVAAGGDPQQVEAVTKVVSDPVSVVLMAVAPAENAAIVGGALQQGAQSIFIGAGPTWNVGLLDTAAAPAFQSGAYFQSSFVPAWDYDSPGHEKMRQTLDAVGVDPNDFFVTGWVMEYPLHAVLEQAVANGDLTRDGGGIAAAAAAVTDVGFDGMMPEQSYVGAPDEFTPRQSLIHSYDAESSTGMSVVQDFFAGPTAQAYTLDAPCVGV